MPDFGTDLISFDMRVEFADSTRDWTAVSQGDRLDANSWQSDQPMEEVYLIAAAFSGMYGKYPLLSFKKGQRPLIFIFCGC